MQEEAQVVQDLVLIGGGHSHAIALKKFGMNPLPGVKLTLISDVVHTPYSGMLPGYVAGLYRFEDCHIDLYPLSQFAQAQIICDRAIGLDLDNNRVLLAHRPPIAFDLLSIDIGSTPAILDLPGAQTQAVPVKPISQFLRHWDQLVTEIAQKPQEAMRLAIVGGGAGGVELALSIQARLDRIYQTAGHSAPVLHLLHRGDRLLPERSAGFGRQVEQLLTARGVKVHLRQSVAAIEAGPDQEKVIRCESGLSVRCDRVFWVTRASAAPWLKQSGLATDAEGFIQVSDTLQSISHPQVFAAGDVATMVNHPRPKAGVFAVRQGTPLTHNLRCAAQNQPLRPFVPQTDYLILLGTGDSQAIASRGPFNVGPHPLLWRWKDQIDRQFMAQFTDLQPMTAASHSAPLAAPVAAPVAMRCAGCGSKIGNSVLSNALTRIKAEYPEGDRPDILIGLDAPDDAAVIRVPVGQVMVQTIDYFRALVDDPFLFGQICANHCLSDIFAMGAMPQSGLAIATLPAASEGKQAELLYQLLSGAVQVLHQAGAALIGGHTTEGPELAFGLTCNGTALAEQLWRKRDMQPGQALILTKAIGTGTLFAAKMQLQARGIWIDSAIQSMLLSNQAAAICLRAHGATACTDVTGFGLLGHLLEMVQASQVSVCLELEAIPMLVGATETTQQQIFSSLHPQNLAASRSIRNLDQAQLHPLYPLLFDPQTSGGLIASLPADRAIACLSALQNLGYPHSRLIGTVMPQDRQDEQQSAEQPTGRLKPTEKPIEVV